MTLKELVTGTRRDPLEEALKEWAIAYEKLLELEDKLEAMLQETGK